ncbi:hypothetical protein IW492_03715 [Enterococcus sp. BWB1-3]|nr:hypothetical protein [Enterococcus sp. BWB1-3]
MNADYNPIDSFLMLLDELSAAELGEYRDKITFTGILADGSSEKNFNTPLSYPVIKL